MANSSAPPDRRLGLLPALAFYAVFVLRPLAWLIGLSLRQGDGYSAPCRSYPDS